MTRIVIIGGGPAGYEAALVAASLGAEVTVIERDGIGGASVLSDCVPSKTLIASAGAMTGVRDSAALGVHGAELATVGLDLPAVNQRVKGLAVAQSADIKDRLLAEGVRVVAGQGRMADEVRGLAELAHAHDLVLHVDGARLANAAAARDSSLATLTAEAGVDLVSFGGTKNGLLFGEAVVVLRQDLAHGLEYLRKQSMQLASKMRFPAAQLSALLEGDVWLRNARHANAMARRLAEAVREVEGFELTQRVEANAVFATLPRRAIDALLDRLPGENPFYVWDEAREEVRWMCSWDTAPDDVERFAAELRHAVHGAAN